MSGSGLAVQDIVSVDVTIEPAAAQYRNFGIELILGSSDVIDIQERYRNYSDIAGVAEDFGVNAPEYAAAEIFFSQKPQPGQVWIGRWAQTAVAGLLHGATLSASEQLLSNFDAITNGAFNISIDGVPYSVPGINLEEVLNLNAVAFDIQTALQSATGNAAVTCVWDASNERFNITSGTTGPTSSVGPASAPAALGNIAFTANPAAATTVTIGGTAVTFVAGSPTGNQVAIGANLAATLTALQTFLNNSTDVNISKASYLVVGTTLYVIFKIAGTGGNTFTLATTVSGATPSGAELTGGAGTDLSTLCGLTAAAEAYSVQGLAAESFLSAVVAMDELSNGWYNLVPAALTPISDQDLITGAQYIEGTGTSRTFFPTTGESNALNPDTTSDLGGSLQTLGLNRTAAWYSSSNPYTGASGWGLGATINYEGDDTTITWMWKQLPGVTAETLNETQSAALKAKGYNYFADYNNGKAITQWGTMAGGDYIDEVVNTDWLQNFVQTNVFNLFYDTPTKIPQTDAGNHQILNEVNDSLQQAVTNGTLAENGIWSGPPIGSVNAGDTLSAGFYVYAPAIATQTQADRAARRSVPFQAACTLAGANHTTSIALNFVR